MEVVHRPAATVPKRTKRSDVSPDNGLDDDDASSASPVN
jgi:hypothetical protein